VIVFNDLVTKRNATNPCPSDDDDEEDNNWKLEWYDEESGTAGFSWMGRSLMLSLQLGPRLETKKSRKSVSRSVVHFPVTRISLEPTHSECDSKCSHPPREPDPIQDAAHYSICRKFTEPVLRSMCPNTFSLSSLLKNISQFVTPANQFMWALDYVDGNHYPFNIKDNVVTVGFVSTVLEQSFDITVDFSGGFSSAPDTLNVKTVVGSPNIMGIEKVARLAPPGPRFIREMADKVDQYLSEKEKLTQRGEVGRNKNSMNSI
jgi:hypothetical protein